MDEELLDEGAKKLLKAAEGSPDWVIDGLRQDLLKAAWRKQRAPLHNSHRDFLDTLYAARQRMGMTQNDLAECLGIAQSTIARIESGKGNPSLKTLIKIANALEVNLVLKPAIICKT